MKTRLILTSAIALVATTGLTAQTYSNWSPTWPGTNSSGWGPSGASAPALFKPSPWVLGGNWIDPANTTNATYRTPSIGTTNDAPFVLKANNLECVYLNQGTQVGIGLNNTSPSAALDIWTASNAANNRTRLRIFADALGNIESSGNMSLNYTGLNNFYITQLQGPAPGPLQRFMISSSGNVGINNTNPSAALDIIDPNNSGRIKIFANQFGSIQSTNNMEMHVGNTNYFSVVEDLSSGPAERLTVVNGNVGINEVGPAEKLHVNGNVRVTGNVGVGAFPALEKLHVSGGNMRVDGKASVGGPLIGPDNLTVYDPVSAILRVHSGTWSAAKIAVENAGTGYNFNIDGTSPQPIGHISTGVTTGVDLINFSPAGWPQYPQVWIGRKPTTSHTDFHFAVDGKIVAHSMYLTLNCGWADYVFAPEYKLPKLEDVEAFYKENQHLPEIPSAKEVEENGIAVAEMNVLLLKKVEELTLYVVEQQKEINKLKMNQHHD
jgi:hypothetical protein